MEWRVGGVKGQLSDLPPCPVAHIAKHSQLAIQPPPLCHHPSLLIAVRLPLHRLPRAHQHRLPCRRDQADHQISRAELDGPAATPTRVAHEQKNIQPKGHAGLGVHPGREGGHAAAQLFNSSTCTRVVLDLNTLNHVRYTSTAPQASRGGARRGSDYAGRDYAGCKVQQVQEVAIYIPAYILYRRVVMLHVAGRAPTQALTDAPTQGSPVGALTACGAYPRSGASP